MRELSYIVMPGSYIYNDAHLELHNKIFSFWYHNWSKVFSGLASPISIKESEFRRQSYVSALITSNYEVVGLTLHTIFNLLSYADCNHHYFKNNYSDLFLYELKKRNYNRVMTIEYLTVGEGFRRSNFGISAARFLAALAHRLQINLNLEVSIYSCRKDLQVDKLAMQLGGSSLNSPGFFNGVETQNLVTRTSDIVEPDSIKNEVDFLWNHKKMIFGPRDVGSSQIDERFELNQSL